MTRLTPISCLVGGAALGAASMYFLDPDRGKRRRHRAVDRARGAVTDVEELAGKAERDLEHRGRGFAARVRQAGPSRLLAGGSPEQRLLQGGVGAALALWGFVRGRIVGAGAVVAGASLIASAAVARQDGEIRIQKTLTIDAPVAEVYALWTRLDDFPRFLEHVLEVRTEGDRSHWRVAGPAGVEVEWDAEITERIADRKIAWRSLPGSRLEHHGEIHFERADDDATRISVHMAYRPVGGALGHAVARLLMADPKTLIDADLLRLQSLLERGKTRVRGDQVSLDDLGA